MGSFLTTDWEMRWNINETAAPLNNLDTGYEAYPELVCPFLFDNDLIAIYAENPQAKITWQSAGSLFQRVRTGITVGGGNDSITAKIRVRLNTINLIRLPWKISGWQLSFLPHHWHKEIRLQAWEYTASLPTTDQQSLDLLQNDITNQLLVMNTKIDAVGTIVTEIQGDLNNL